MRDGKSMPDYIYKCIHCHYKTVHTLKMSFDPAKKLFCSECSNTTPSMTRRIGRPSFPTNVGKVFAGDWYKKQYGHELGEGSMNAAQQAEDRKTLEREFRKKTGQ